MDLKHIIDQKDHYADYMVDEITHICRDFEKREPGSKGEQQACEYMAQVLKKDCGCQRADVESFKENPGSFFGWIYFTITFVLAAIVCFFFCRARIYRTGIACGAYIKLLLEAAGAQLESAGALGANVRVLHGQTGLYV